MLTVRYFASARTAAGVAEEQVAAPTLAALLGQLAAARGERLAKVLAMASYLVDGIAWHDHGAELPAGAIIDVLPPFAGG